LRLPWLIPALAFPGVWVTLVTGQNSLFTAAAAGAALVLLRRSPVAAGACIAMLCIKPQLGILFPLYLLCERQWRTLASAAFFS
ncbi:glycosyltransferase family 87 protein, partial [Mammaliicoccus sciuri]